MGASSTQLDFPTVHDVPVVTTEQMREVDRAMMEDYGISLARMMENAGRSLAELVRHKLGGRVQAQRIVVLAGRGNNGGGGMVAARHLYNWGAQVFVAVAQRENSRVTNEQLAILSKMDVPIANAFVPEEIGRADLLIDALIGYGLKGAPRGETAEWIRLANASRKPIIALDTPSGLDTNSGEIFAPCIYAHATLTLALPKTGLYAAGAARVNGELYVADISVPRALYENMGLHAPNLFAESSIVRVR